MTEATPVGVTFAGFMPLGPQAAVDVAREAGELGYRSFWTAETTGPEAFSLLGAVAGVAPGLDLGTGVLALQLRTPQVTAMAAATLQALAPDRDVLLGIGISSPVVTGQWHGVAYGDRPLAQVREYVALVRECLTGESVTFEGDFYSAKRFRLGIRQGERRPKIVIGALNPGMLRLAGEVADGVLLNYLPASHVPWSVEQVRKGGDAEVYAYVHVGVADREQAADNARKDLFSYAVVDAYARNFERAGFADEVADDPRAPRRQGPGGRRRRGVRPDGRRHRRRRRRRPSCAPPWTSTWPTASTTPSSCPCPGAPTAARSSPTPSKPSPADPQPYWRLIGRHGDRIGRQNRGSGSALQLGDHQAFGKLTAGGQPVGHDDRRLVRVVAVLLVGPLVVARVVQDDARGELVARRRRRWGRAGGCRRRTRPGCRRCRTSGSGSPSPGRAA